MTDATIATAAEPEPRGTFIVKQAELHPAQRNPFRPGQKLKRGNWRVIGKFPTLEGAEIAFNAAAGRGGLRETAIFLGGKMIKTTR